MRNTSKSVKTMIKKSSVIITLVKEMTFTVPHLREFCKIPIVNSKVIGNALNNCFTSAGAKKTKYHTFTHYSDYINSGNTNKLFLKYVL